LFFDLWRPTSSDVGGEEGLHRKRDKVVVVKQSREEIVYLGNLTISIGRFQVMKVDMPLTVHPCSS
jgi:hypothetical protein